MATRLRRPRRREAASDALDTPALLMKMDMRSWHLLQRAIAPVAAIVASTVRAVW
jgi:hypothetical protein